MPSAEVTDVDAEEDHGFFDKLMDDISFSIVVEDSKRKSELWSTLERVLAQLPPAEVPSLAARQTYMVDIVLQHVGLEVYRSSAEVWTAASRCLLTLHTRCGALLWQLTDTAPAELLSSLFDVSTAAIKTGKNKGKEHAVQAALVASRLLRLAEVRALLNNDNTNNHSSYHIRTSFRDCLCGLVTALAQPGSHLRKFLVLVLVRCHAALCSVPSPCPVPSSGAGRGAVGTGAVRVGAESALRAGLQRQHTIMQGLLLTVQCCLADGSFEVDDSRGGGGSRGGSAGKGIRSELVSACASLACCDCAGVRYDTRCLLYQLLSGRTDLVGASASISATAITARGTGTNSINTSTNSAGTRVTSSKQAGADTGAETDAHLPLRRVLATRSIYDRFGGPFLQGLGRLVQDQDACARSVGVGHGMGQGAGQTQGWGGGMGAVQALQEAVELFAEHAVTRLVSGGEGMPFLADLSEVLGAMAQQRQLQQTQRPSADLSRALRRAADCGVGGAGELLDAYSASASAPFSAPISAHASSFSSASSSSAPPLDGRYGIKSIGDSGGGSNGTSSGGGSVGRGSVIDLSSSPLHPSRRPTHTQNTQNPQQPQRIGKKALPGATSFFGPSHAPTSASTSTSAYPNNPAYAYSYDLGLAKRTVDTQGQGQGQQQGQQYKQGQQGGKQGQGQQGQGQQGQRSVGPASAIDTHLDWLERLEGKQAQAPVSLRKRFFDEVD
ncbi:hypothetical protein B484DRAFT_437477, partial [Ochromonadaceae sp. CCMP2298]